MDTKKKNKQKIQTEAQEQIKFVVWITLNYVNKGILKISASANGGSRHPLEAMKLKRMGVSKGFPDVEIPYPIGDYHGLYIEFKRQKGGKVSEEQQHWIDYLNSKRYYACVAHGFDEAKEIFENYFAFGNI